MPAEVRIKTSLEHPDDFFHLDKSNWYHNEMPRKVYEDPVQESVRRILGRSLVRTFGLFTYEKYPLADKHIPTFGVPHEAVIMDVIEIAENEFAHHKKTLVDRIENLKGIGKMGEAAWWENSMLILVRNFTRMSPAFLARQILETTHTYRVNKNWNSHGGQLGAGMCQLGSILASLQGAVKSPLVSTHFPEVIPRGCVQTGAKHGNQDVTYVEYMCVAMERHMIIGGDASFLDHVKFHRDNHAQKVHQIFDEKMTTGDVTAPVPRPTRAHTMDFNCTYMGARLIDGECKGVAPIDAPLILVLHAAQQLAFKNEGLAMLTTNKSFTFYHLTKDISTHHIKVTYHELPKFVLEPITDLNVDFDRDIVELADPPTYSVPDLRGGFLKESEETHARILDLWDTMRSEQKKMVNAILYAVDIIAEHIVTLDLNEIAAKREQSFKAGNREPFFLATEEPSLKTRRPLMAPHNFVYCSETIEGKANPQEVHEFNRMMFDHYYNILLNGGNEVDDEIIKMCKEGMERHKNTM